MLRILPLLVLSLILGAAESPRANDDAAIFAASKTSAERYQRHISRLRARLDHADPEVRHHAFLALARTYDARQIPHLIGYLDADAHPVPVVVDAVHALAIMRATEAAPALKRLATRPENALRLAAHNALAQIRELGPAAYERASKDSNPQLRAMGVTDLGTLSVRDAGATLAEALDDRREHIRRMAAIGLGRLGDATHADALISALTDPDALVRRYAAEALVLLDHKPAIPYLLIALEGGTAAGHMARALTTLTGEDFGYVVHGDAVSRRAAIERGFRWWSENADRFQP